MNAAGAKAAEEYVANNKNPLTTGIKNKVAADVLLQQNAAPSKDLWAFFLLLLLFIMLSLLLVEADDDE
jgi:hypothetical protein